MKIYICDKCKKAIKQFDTVWRIQGIGNYRSFLDGQKIHKHFCDNCLNRFLNNNGGVDNV